LPAAVILLGIVPAAILPGKVRGGEAGPPVWNPKAAAAYLDGRAAWWLNWSGAARGQGTACLSCHTTLPFALARPALGRHLGEAAPDTALDRLLANVRKRVDNWDSIVAHPTPDKDPLLPFYAKDRKPTALGTEVVLNALVLVREDAGPGGALSAPTRKALAHLWQQQQANGAWLWLDFGLNPWEKDATYYGAALAALAVGTAGGDYCQQADVRPKVAALKQYLRTQFANQPLHHRVVALWASSRLPDLLTAPERKALLEELVSTQESDGGWSLPKLGKSASGQGPWASHRAYPEGMVSDGYATGLVVLALKGAGAGADSPPLRKAVRWLVTRQTEGTWPVHYPNRQRDPQTDTGKFMRDAATAFAVLALTEPVEPARGNGNRAGQSSKRANPGGPAAVNTQYSVLTAQY
jgi:squalene-hopene/tetraprenyl-beta-curcumene cyclase